MPLVGAPFLVRPRRPRPRFRDVAGQMGLIVEEEPIIKAFDDRVAEQIPVVTVGIWDVAWAGHATHSPVSESCHHTRQPVRGEEHVVFRERKDFTMCSLRSFIPQSCKRPRVGDEYEFPPYVGLSVKCL